MMELTTTDDIHSRTKFRLREFRSDRAQNWDVSLQTNDLPSAFENASDGNRQVSLEIMSFDKINLAEHNNAFFIPLDLICISQMEGKTVCYYQSRHQEQDGSILRASVSASITLEGDNIEMIDNPYLKMEFNVVKQEEGSLQGNRQQFDMTKPAEPYVRTDANENANGGLDIPLKEMDRPLNPSDRVVQPA